MSLSPTAIQMQIKASIEDAKTSAMSPFMSSSISSRKVNAGLATKSMKPANMADLAKNVALNNVINKGAGQLVGSVKGADGALRTGKDIHGVEGDLAPINASSIFNSKF